MPRTAGLVVFRGPIRDLGDVQDPALAIGIREGSAGNRHRHAVFDDLPVVDEHLADLVGVRVDFLVATADQFFDGFSVGQGDGVVDLKESSLVILGEDHMGDEIEDLTPTHVRGSEEGDRFAQIDQLPLQIERDRGGGVGSRWGILHFEWLSCALVIWGSRGTSRHDTRNGVARKWKPITCVRQPWGRLPGIESTSCGIVRQSAGV